MPLGDDPKKDIYLNRGVMIFDRELVSGSDRDGHLRTPVSILVTDVYFSLDESPAAVGSVTINILDDGASILTAPLSIANTDPNETIRSETGMTVIIAAGSKITLDLIVTATARGFTVAVWFKFLE